MNTVSMITKVMNRSSRIYVKTEEPTLYKLGMMMEVVLAGF